MFNICLGTDSNNCSDSKYPCASWSYVASKINGNETSIMVNVGKGVFNVTNGLDSHLQLGYWWFTVNWTITGDKSGQTVLQSQSSFVDQFCFSGITTSVNIAHFTYLSNYQPGRLGSFVNILSIDISNFIVHGWGSYNMMYVNQAQTLTIANMEILDVNLNQEYVFAIYHTNYAVFRDIVCNITGTEIDSSKYDYKTYFAHFESNDNSTVTLKNMVIANYYLFHGFYIEQNDYSQFFFNNIIFENVRGRNFFYISGNRKQTISINNLSVDCHNQTMDAEIIFSYGNSYTELTVTNSNFRNMQLRSSAFFYNSYKSEPVILKNVIFSNINSSSTHYGLIFIHSDGDVIIDNCTFSQNKNLMALIHCDKSSYCNVTIKDSIFEENYSDKLCNNGKNIVNGLFLDKAAHGHVNIINTLFIGIPSIIADSTSMVTIDNNTQQMMVDTNTERINDKCAVYMDIIITNNVYVLFSVVFLPFKKMDIVYSQPEQNVFDTCVVQN